MTPEFNNNPELQNQKQEILVLSEFPAIHPTIFATENGTLYLKSPGVVMISAPSVNLSGMQEFLDGYPDEYEFSDYLSDPTKLDPAEQLVKVAGQVCYASFGTARTKNESVGKYIGNLISSGHGSVLEHANFSLLMYGISRSLTHELVRHRAGMGFSQLSQRYVSGRVLRFVERPEYQTDQNLHKEFEMRIDRASQEYEKMSDKLLEMQNEGSAVLSAEQKTDRRKKVQQAARSLLPNETETVMVATGNVRAWRHVISMRASEHAEVEIRDAMFKAYQILRASAPILFGDFEEISFPDGTFGVKTQYPKV